MLAFDHPILLRSLPGIVETLHSALMGQDRAYYVDTTRGSRFPPLTVTARKKNAPRLIGCPTSLEAVMDGPPSWDFNTIHVWTPASRVTWRTIPGFQGYHCHQGYSRQASVRTGTNLFDPTVMCNDWRVWESCCCASEQGKLVPCCSHLPLLKTHQTYIFTPGPV